MSAIRTHALPNCCSTKGKISSSTPMARVLRVFELFIADLPFLSRAIGYTFTHQARGPQCEHNDEHDDHDAEQPLHISQHMLTLNQISTETATAVTLIQKIHLYMRNKAMAVMHW